MKDLNKIVWLASYPKSGNTWFRAFLTSLKLPENKTFDINNLFSSTIASNREFFDEFAGVYSSDLNVDEIDLLRPGIYKQNALESDDIIFHKIHDAWTLSSDNKPLFPSEITKAVIYIIRNPLDVAVSFSHHLAISIDKTIAVMNNPNYCFCSKNDKLHLQLRQKLLTWSDHVNSWTLNSGLPVIVIRYEDMKTDPIITFSRALKFIGMKVSENRIKKAVKDTTFENLKKQENEKGFAEKSYNSKYFFRKGISGDWKNILSQEQVHKISEEHAEVMKRFRYQ